MEIIYEILNVTIYAIFTYPFHSYLIIYNNNFETN